MIVTLLEQSSDQMYQLMWYVCGSCMNINQNTLYSLKKKVHVKHTPMYSSMESRYIVMPNMIEQTINIYILDGQACKLKMIKSIAKVKTIQLGDNLI